MQSTLEISRSLVPFGYSVNYSLSGASSAEKLSRIVDITLRNILPGNLTARGVLRDLKGVERRMVEELVGPARITHQQELFFLCGEIPALGGNEEVLPFEVSAGTAFKEFVGSAHIDHEILIESRELLAHIPLNMAGRAVPLRLREFRSGLDLFERSRFGGLLGMTPSVTQSFIIAASTSVLTLELRAEGLKKPAELPLQRDNLFENLAQGIRAVFDFDLRTDYLAKART